LLLLLLLLQDAIREAQGIPLILVAMTTHAGHDGVQEQACRALGCLALDQSANQVQWFY
jgi:hypothetical protein